MAGKPTLKPSVISSADVLETGDIDIDDNFNDISFSLHQNIYTFLLLLYSRENEENKGLYSLFDEWELRKIKLLAFLSFTIQMSGMLYLLCNWSRWYVDYSDILSISECTISSLVNNGTIIDDQECRFYKDAHTANQSADAENIAAKFIAVLMLMAFLTSDMLSVPRLITLSKITKSKLKYVWILYTASQVILIGTTLIRIFTLIYNQDDVIDIFTVGISFIILVEIDDKMYTSIHDLNRLGDKLFCVKINKGKLSKRNVIYNYISLEKYDCIFCISVFLGALVLTFVWVCLPYITGYNKHTIGYTDNWYISLTFATAVLFMVIPGVIIPSIPTCLCKCREQ